MFNRFAKLALFGLAASVFLGAEASATSIINGSIQFKGDVVLDDGDGNPLTLPTTGNAVSIEFNNVVTGTNTQTGDYLVVGNNTAATINDLTFLPTFSPVTPLWTLQTMVGANLWTFAFDLSTVNIVLQNSTFLVLEGSGTASITGAGSDYAPTAGFWTFSTQSGSPTLTFSSGTNVPDGGATALMLGASLLGVGIVARKKAVASV